MRRNVLHSKQKAKVRAVKMHWKDKSKEIRGMFENKKKIEAQKRIAMIDKK